MAENKNDHVIIAFFSSEEVAHSAAETLKGWDKANEEVKLGAVGVMTANPEGKISFHVGRKTGKGATIGAIVGVIAGVVSGGLSILGGLIAGGAIGAITGSFFKKSTHLTKEEIEKIGEELKSGKGAVIVTCDDFEVDGTVAQLAKLGGDVKAYDVSADAIADAAAAGAGDAAAALTPAERATQEVANAELDAPPPPEKHGPEAPPPQSL